MRLRGSALCAGIALVFAVVGLTVSPVFASYGSDGGLTVDPTQMNAGGHVMIDSSGWKPVTSVTITLHSTPVVLSTETADGNGGVQAQVTIPSSAEAGAHTIVLTGTAANGDPREVSTAFTVTSGSGSLPRTGAAISALVIVGLVLLAGGIALSTARKRATR